MTRKPLYLAVTKFPRKVRTFAVLAVGVFLAWANFADAQMRPPNAWQAAPTANATSSVPPAAPETIFWKQNLFLIPYQWSTAADPSAAQAVWLYVSRDRGASWQKISEAKPHVKAFNYHAEADGEYWFAIRTVDNTGQPRPAGPMLPELRVVVDTEMPQIEELRGTPLSDGRLNIQWTATDRQLDPHSLRIEVQTNASAEWIPVSVSEVAPTADGVLVGQVVWSPPSGSRPVAVRATVSDLAGNPAFFQTEAGASSPGPLARAPMPTLTAEPNNMPSSPYPQTSAWNNEPKNPFGPPSSFGNERDELVPAAPPLATPPTSAGWMSPSAATTQPVGPGQQTSQTWNADVNAPVPFRLANSGRPAAGGTSNSATTYGNPVVAGGNAATSSTDRYAESDSPGLVPVDPADAQAAAEPPYPSASSPPHTALQPFRQASIAHPAITTSEDSPPSGFEYEKDFAPNSGSGLSTLDSRLGTPVWSGSSTSLLERWGVTVPRGVEPKYVNSRTFSLEYQVEDVGGWGVSKVQLWGTRDGGQTWHYYAEDDDNRSPLNVTVDGEGLYGFRIVVQSAAGPGGFAPQSGDQPELWVGVDLHRPQAELLSVEPGAGNLSDHLVLRWRADDDNLQPRPISLFYSSRPTGPWSAAATGLQNTGEYAWRLERYVPAEFYLRLEVRDTAGNLAAYQTVEPIRLMRPEPTGSLRAVEPVDPTAAATSMQPR